MVGPAGLEPATPCLDGRASIRHGRREEVFHLIYLPVPLSGIWRILCRGERMIRCRTLSANSRGSRSFRGPILITAAAVWTLIPLAYPQSMRIDGRLSCPHVGLYAHQGTSVALSADGNTVLVGASGANDQLGAACVWTRVYGLWSQQGPALVGSGVTSVTVVGSQSAQGWSVSLSADGNTAIVGGPYDNAAGGTAVG